MIEYEGDYSIDEYKGIKFGQKYEIDGYSYIVYRIDDRIQQIVLLCKKRGFFYLDFKDISILKEV